MISLGQLFNRHPREAGQSYGEHFAFAITVAWLAGLAAVAAFVHAFLPFVLKTTASKCVMAINEMIYRRTLKGSNK